MLCPNPLTLWPLNPNPLTLTHWPLNLNPLPQSLNPLTVTPHFCCFDYLLTVFDFLTVFDDWYSVPFVKNSRKQSKQRKMTIGVPIVACLHRVRRIHNAAQTPLPCGTSITCAWAVATATARRPWAGLTLCVYVDVYASGCRSLPNAATLVMYYNL